jgi:hypothetical protein
MNTLALVSIASLVLAGCAAAPAEDSSAGNAETSAAPEATPVPVATLKAANGNTIEFYDFGTGAVVMETGSGASTSLLPKEEATAAQLSSLWRSLSPDTAVPSSIERMQDRLTHLDTAALSQAATPPAVDGAGPQSALDANTNNPAGVGTSQQALRQGCNNICCDTDWVAANCNFGGNNYSWSVLNYGYSYANSQAYHWFGRACAAQGTSTFRMSSAGGLGGVWSVPEGTWRSYSWFTGTNWIGNYYTQSISSSVNDVGNQHLHSYCGYSW